MKNSKFLFSLFIVVLLLVIGVFIFFFKNDLNTFFSLTTKKKSTLTLALDDKIESFDPAKTYSDDTLLITTQVLEPLYQYHYLKRPYEIVPLLADSLPYFSDDGKEVRIKIKKNVFYHSHPSFSNSSSSSGKRKLIAEDFVTQFKRLALDELNSPARGFFNPLIVGFKEYNAKVSGDWRKISSTPLEGVYAADDETLVLKLLKKDFEFIYYLAMNFVVPLPWEFVVFCENNIDDNIIGTGPYILKKKMAQSVELIQNSQYRTDYYPSSGDRLANVENLLDSSREKIPFIDQIIFYISKDEKEKWQSYLEGKANFISVPKTLISMIYDEKGGLTKNLKERESVVRHFPRLANRWIGLNMRDPILRDNKFLRLAIAHGIDYERYLKILSQNTSLRSNSIVVPSIPGYRPSNQFLYQFDREKSKSYFKKALQNFSLKKIKIKYSTRGEKGINLIEAEFLKEQLEKTGFEVEIEVLSFTDFIKKGRQGELMIFTDSWIFDYPNAENIMQLLISSNIPGINKSGYSNPQVDNLYKKFKASRNSEIKLKVIQDIENILMDDVVWIPLFFESSFIIHHSSLKNFRESGMIRNYLKYLKIQ